MLTGFLHFNTNENHMPTRVGTKGHENVIPAKTGIQRIRELDSRLHGNDRLEVFSYQTNTESNANDMAPVNGGQAVSATAETASEGNLNSDNFIAILSAILSGLNNAITEKDSNELQVTSNIKDSNELQVTSNKLNKEENLSLNKLVTNNSLLVTAVNNSLLFLTMKNDEIAVTGEDLSGILQQMIPQLSVASNQWPVTSNQLEQNNSKDSLLVTRYSLLPLTQVKAMTDSAQRLNQVLSGHDARPEGNWAAQTAANAVAKNENNPPSPPFIKGWMGGFSGENAAGLKNNYTGSEQGHQQGHQRNGIEIIKSIVRGSGSADRVVTEGSETLSASKQSSMILNSASGPQTSYSQDAVVKDSMHITKLYEIGNFFIKTLNSGSRHLTINLQPPDLGSIQIKLKMTNGILTANLKVESAAVKELFSSALPQIRASLADSGVKLSDFFVDVKKEDNYYDSMKQHRDGSQHDNQRQKRQQEYKFDYFA